MEMGSLRRGIPLPRAAAVTLTAAMLMVILTERTGMEGAEADMGRAVPVMVGTVKAGRKVLIVKARWTPRWTARRWTRWTARQIRLLMVLLSPEPPKRKKSRWDS